MPEATKTIHAKASTTPERHLVRRAWGLIQAGSYRGAARLLRGHDDKDLNTALPARLAANLEALRVSRPEVARVLAEAGPLVALQRYPLTQTPSGAPAIEGVTQTSDPRAAAAAVLKKAEEATAAGEPFLFADVGDGYLLVAVAASRRTFVLWQQQAVWVVERDPYLLLVCLMLHDWTGPDGPIADPRFMWHVGGDAVDAFVEECRGDTMLPPPTMALGRTRCTEEALLRLKELRAWTAERTQVCSKEISAYYDDDPSWRMVAGTAGTSRRPRVLLITSRFTTVLQYSTADSAQAFEAMGWDTRTVIEPSDIHRSTRLSILQALNDFKPDLVFSIDSLRSHIPGVFPPQLPHVCWIQDQLPRLTSAEAGASIGRRDFVLSMVTPMYTGQWGYPARQMIDVPKLTRPPVRPTEWVCDGDDLVYVSNASQRVEALVEGFASGSLERACAETMVAAYGRGESLPTWWHVGRIVDAVAGRRGERVVDQARAQLVNRLFLPLNNALYRQQALGWVADAAEDLGLTLAIYGNGWAEHPDFAAYARGPVAYGPDLEALTRRSKINLQIIPSFCLHQRLLDGLVAGGFFLVREHASDRLMPPLLSVLDPSSESTAQALAVAGPRRAELERLLKGAECLTDLGMPVDPVAWVRTCQRGRLMDTSGAALPEADAVLFDDAAGLRERLERFIYDAPARRLVADAQRRSVEGRLSYEAGLGRALGRIAGQLVQSEGGG